MFDKPDWIEDAEVDHGDFNDLASAIAPVFVVFNQSLRTAKALIALFQQGFLALMAFQMPWHC